MIVISLRYTIKGGKRLKEKILKPRNGMTSLFLILAFELLSIA